MRALRRLNDAIYVRAYVRVYLRTLDNLSIPTSDGEFTQLEPALECAATVEEWTVGPAEGLTLDSSLLRRKTL